MGKLIIMSTNLGGVPPDHEPFIRGSQEDIGRQIGYLLYDIWERLGELRNAAKVSDDARKINDERILQLVERVTRTESALPFLRDIIDRNNADLRATTDGHATDLNGLGRVAHTTVSFGQLALALIAGGILTALVIHFLK